MAAVFYMEPILTFDLDVFVLLPASAEPLVSLAPLYDALRRRGYAEEQDHVNIEGVPVQFLPVFNRLSEEALENAQDTRYEATPTRVLRPEHLVAIMLETGRDKDRQRLTVFLNQARIDRSALLDIVQRHGLEARWQTWIG